ncbi:MAG TPA: hypothetical protein V6D18_07040 [Thermosynechococcaceae cyanobacterium]
MKIGGKCAIVGFTVGASLFASAAMAQPVFLNPGSTVVTVPGDSRGVLPEYDDAYFSTSGDFFDNRTVFGQTKFLLGPFVENQISRDGQNVLDTYKKTLARQTGAGPVVRTIDVPTPFNQSLRTVLNTPPTPFPVVERTPLYSPAPVAPAAPTAPAALPAETGPVPALW